MGFGFVIPGRSKVQTSSLELKTVGIGPEFLEKRTFRIGQFEPNDHFLALEGLGDTREIHVNGHAKGLMGEEAEVDGACVEFY